MKNKIFYYKTRPEMLKGLRFIQANEDKFILDVTTFFAVATDTYYISICYLDDTEN